MQMSIASQEDRVRGMSFLLRGVAGLMALSLLAGCAAKQVIPALPEPPFLNTACTERTVCKEELEGLVQCDPELDLAACGEILARLNIKDRRYVMEDIQNGRKLKVPEDFRAYKEWTPLPERLPDLPPDGKLILVVKNIPFLGWYEGGRLLGDTQVCIGKKRGWTKTGFFSVMEKDIDHVSASYRSAYGYPALMPFALRVYGRVWIHGGDVVKGNCSHGCINLPLSAAEDLFGWADPGTAVLIVESLAEVDAALLGSTRRLASASL